RSEHAGLKHIGIGAVQAVAPAVERADESGVAGAVALDDLDGPVTTGVEVRLDLVGGCPDDDDRLVEDLVLGEVARLRDLLEAACHLPYPRPEQLGFQGKEVGIVVPLLRYAIGARHRPRDDSRCPACFLANAHGASSVGWGKGRVPGAQASTMISPI